eukprot:6182717-Pleurochrysis_carterae.AAC.1
MHTIRDNAVLTAALTPHRFCHGAEAGRPRKARSAFRPTTLFKAFGQALLLFMPVSVDATGFLCGSQNLSCANFSARALSTSPCVCNAPSPFIL